MTHSKLTTLAAALVCASVPALSLAQSSALTNAGADKQSEASQWLEKAAPKIQSRSHTINGILQAMGGQLSQLPDPRERAKELALHLHRLNDAQLALASEFGSLAKLDAFLAAPAATPSKRVGDDNSMVFTPVTPCRIADSRSSSAGKLMASVARNYRGEASPGQGGTIGCGVMGWAAGTPGALALTLTATQAEGPGWLTVAPDGEAGGTSSLNYQPGVDIAASTIIKSVGHGVSSPTVNDFNITASANVHVIVDVLGYYSRSEQTPLECNTVFNTVQISEGPGAESFALPACAANFTRVDTFCKSDSYENPLLGVLPDSCVFGRFETLGSGSVGARCCRIPGRTAF